MRWTVTGLCAVLFACGPTRPTLHDGAQGGDGAEGDGTAAAEGADAGESSAGDDSAATTGGDGSDLEDDARRRRLAVGNYHSCLLREDGAVRCWGDNIDGALGLGADFDGPYLGDREPPTAQPPIDLAGTAVSIGSGRWHVCAHMQSKALRCWGSNVRGQLGVPRIEQIGIDDVPSDHAPVDVGFDVSSLWVTGTGTCARGAPGIRCWQPPGGQAQPAAPSPAGDLPLSGLRAASESCVVTSEGELRCWGANEFGQVGVGHTEEVPYDPEHMGEVIALPEPVVDVQQGAFYRTCVVLASGAVRCWGFNDGGYLGLGHTITVGDNELPAEVDPVGLAGPAETIVLGAFHSCALLRSGDVTCWGQGGPELGLAHESAIGDDETPGEAAVVDLGGRAVEIGAGADHTCALLQSGAVRCWGVAQYGVLGYGELEDIGDDETPAQAGDVPLD